MHSRRETCSILDAGEIHTLSLEKLHHRDVTTLMRVSVSEIARERERDQRMRYGALPSFSLSLSVSVSISISFSVIFPLCRDTFAAGSFHKATGRTKMPRNYASPYPRSSLTARVSPFLSLPRLLLPHPGLPPTIVVTSSACNSVALPP